MCTQAGFSCNGRIGHIDVNVGSGAGTKLCTVEFSWEDAWGASVAGNYSGDVQ
jgi:hypothetical protein